MVCFEATHEAPEGLQKQVLTSLMLGVQVGWGLCVLLEAIFGGGEYGGLNQ